MKRIILTIIGLLSIHSVIAQSHRFSDLGILFSQENVTGTARFTSLSGAMGALGGDISSVQVNPAGLGVFNHHDFSVTIGTESKENLTTYGGNSVSTSEYDFNFNQIGVAFVLDTENKNWNKIVLGLNYQKTHDFDNIINFSGNNANANIFQEFYGSSSDPNKQPTNTTFNTATSQTFRNELIGDASEFSISIASQYQKRVSLGASLNFKNIDFVQKTTLTEFNTDGNGNDLETLSSQYDSHVASGISLNIGLIYKLASFLRIGLAYESPTWYYETINENNLYDDENLGVVGNVFQDDQSAQLIYERINEGLTTFEYNIKTPNKFTASGALVLGKLGFLSADYSYKNYKAMNLSGEENFSQDNAYFSNTLKNTHNLNVGGELRLGELSLRGGASYQESPFLENIPDRNLDVIRLGDKYSYSAGVGLRFGNHKIDIGYLHTWQNNEYDFYNPTNIDRSENNQDGIITSGEVESKLTNIVATYTYIF